MLGTVLIVAAMAVGAGANTYTVQYDDVTVGGYVCGESQTARVYYPVGSGKFPLISFAHGYNVRHHTTTPGFNECYSTMNTDVAAAGYVVIVLESSRYPLECASEWKDQIRSLDWAKAGNMSSRIDFSKKAGLFGHSMGGGATYHASAQASAVEAQNIGAAVALHPQTFGLQPVTNSLVPIFFGTGSKDNVVSPSSVKSAYSKTNGVPKVFSEIDGATHYEPENDCKGWTSPGQGRHTPYAIAMFDCHLKGNNTQCGKVYGTGSDALCSGAVNMTDCEHADEPTSEAVQV